MAFIPVHTQCISPFRVAPLSRFLSLSLGRFLALTPCTISHFEWKKNDSRGLYVDFSRLCQVEMTSHSTSQTHQPPHQCLSARVTLTKTNLNPTQRVMCKWVSTHMRTHWHTNAE